MVETNRNVRDLGAGSIPKLLAQLAIPAVVAQVVSLIYNIVDRIFIGHIEGIGSDALTGVGLFAPILMLLNAFAMLAGSGGAPRAAISMGERDNETAEKILGNCFTVLMFFAVILTAGIYVFAEDLLWLFGASEFTIVHALAYARTCILGTVFVMITYGMNPFITTQGFAKISMATTLIGATINIILDPIFIFALDLGVKGAALATVVSQSIGAIWVLRFITSDKTILKLRKRNLRLQSHIIGPCLALGISTFVMLSTESLLSISFNLSLSQYGGDIAVGAMTIIFSCAQMIVLPMQGICHGGQPIISYNYGAGNGDRVKKAFFTVFKVNAVYAITSWALIMLFPKIFVSVFTNDTALIEYTTWAIRIYMAGMFAFGFQMTCQQSFMALGQAKVSLILACLRKLILLIPLIFALPFILENKVFAVFLAEPVSDITAAIVTTTTLMIKFNKIIEKRTFVCTKEKI